MAVVCEPNALLEASKCYKCIPAGMQPEVMVYLLNVISGLNLTPQELMERSKCYKCIPVQLQNEVITYLLCQNANGGGSGGCDYQDMQVSWEPTTLKLGEMIGLFTFGDLPALTKLEFKGATSIAGFDLESMSNLLDVSFPNLVSIDPTGSQGGVLYCQGNNALTSFSVPLLQYVDYDFMVEGSQVSTLSYPSLTTVGRYLSAGSNPLLTSWDCPSLVTCGYLRAISCSLLTTVNFPNWIPTDGKTIDFNGSGLNAASVEMILRRCVLAGVATCTINLSGGTNAGTASLNAQGQADVATLGAQLTINP